MDGRPHSPDELLALVQGYIDSVLDGTRTVGNLERAAVERHVRDLERAERGEPFTNGVCRFNPKRGLHILRFAEAFVRYDKPREWAGRPVRFNEAIAWECFLLFVLMGWERQADDGTWVRRFREAYITMSRKQGKTFVAAIIALYLLVAAGEAAAEVYFGATQKAQAAIGWKKVASVVRKSPELKAVIGLPKSRYSYELWPLNDPYDSVCMALSRNDDEFDGKFPFCAVLDELHAYNDSGLYDVMKSGMDGRAGALMLLITTRGNNPESFCALQDRAAEKVVTGKLQNDALFVFMCCLDKGDDWRDPANWPKCAPNIGVTVKYSDLRDAVVTANTEPHKKSGIKTKTFNLWTTRSEDWMPFEKWEACGPGEDGENVFDREAYRGQSAFMAADLSSSLDFTAVATCVAAGSFYDAWMHYWIPEATVAEEEAAENPRGVSIRLWAEQGLVTICPGELVDQDAVREYMLEQRRLYRIKEMAFDPAMAQKLMTELEGLGCPVIQFPQSWAQQNAALTALEDAIISKALRHLGDPVLNWMFSNVLIRKNAQNLRKIDKARSPESIDGMSALQMVVARAALFGKKRSVYEGRGARYA